MTRRFWNQTVIDLGDRWRTSINKVFIQKGKVPVFSINGKLLRTAIKEKITWVEVAFPQYDIVVSKSPFDWLKGEKKMVPSRIGLSPMDFYWHKVPEEFPREGKKKEIYQAVGQLELI